MEKNCNTNFKYLQDALDVIGTKWRVQILFSICVEHNTHFREIERSIEGLSTRMLSRELKIMEQIGLVTRTVKSTTPVEIIYNETKLTHTLIPVFDALLEWGERYSDKANNSTK